MHLPCPVTVKRGRERVQKDGGASRRPSAGLASEHRLSDPQQLLNACGLNERDLIGSTSDLGRLGLLQAGLSQICLDSGSMSLTTTRPCLAVTAQSWAGLGFSLCTRNTTLCGQRVQGGL